MNVVGGGHRACEYHATLMSGRRQWLKLSRYSPQTAPTDEAVNLTSEKHDPCARTVTYKRRKQEHLAEGAGVEPAKYPPKVKLKIYSHNSRVLEKGRLCVP